MSQYIVCMWALTVSQYISVYVTIHKCVCEVCMWALTVALTVSQYISVYVGSHCVTIHKCVCELSLCHNT